MADRTTKVRLLAEVNGYVAGMERAAKATREMADDSTAKLAQQREGFEQLGRTSLAFGAIAAIGVGLAVKRFADFDQAMSNVQAATQESTANMEQLRAAAIAAGGETVFTAVEAANAIEELGKAGLSTTQILEGGLGAALSLAAAGQLEVARAAEITAITIKQFGLNGAQAVTVSDLLAAGAGKAAGDVEDLAQALNQAALVASQTGLSVEETTGVLAAFASAGLLGSDAGTSFRSMLQRLTPQSAEAQRELDRLGISAYDAQGSFIGAAAFAGELQGGLKGLTDQQRNASLAIIFGSDAVRAASVFYEQCQAGIQGWIEATNDSGYAARVAADRLNNLNGDLEKLQGSFESAVIKSGSGANDVLRSLVQTATFLVDGFGSLPEPVLSGGLAFSAVAAAVALAGGAALIGVPRFVAFKAALETTGVSAGRASLAIGGLGSVIGLATIVLTAFVAEQAASAGRVAALKDSLNQTSGAVTTYTRELVVARLQEKGAFEDAAKYGITQRELTDAILEGGEALAEVESKLAAVSEGLTGNQKRAVGLQAEYGVVSTVIRGTRQELEDAEAALRNTEAAADDNRSALDDISSAAADASGEISELSDAIANFGRSQLDTRSALRDFKDSIREATEAIAQNGATLDINTQAGSDNQAALDAIARSANEAAAAVYAQTGSVEETTAVLDEARSAYVEVARAAGDTRSEIEILSESYLATPEVIATEVQLSGVATAANTLAKFYAEWTNKPLTVKFFADTYGLDRAAAAAAARLTGQALASGRENGGLEQYENGGVREGIYRGRPGGILKFAEPNVPWEAFISGKPGQEQRNRAIWEESGRRLGALVSSSGADMPAGIGAGGSSRSITMQVQTQDPAVVAELVIQQLEARFQVSP